MAQIVSIMTVHKAYQFSKPFAESSIDRILLDEAKQINLRDLPSYFYCCSSMISQMEALRDDVTPSLEERARDLVGCDQEADLVDKAIQVLEDSQTVELIQAMLVLPFEHKRMVETHKLDQKYRYSGELSYWQYVLLSKEQAKSMTQGTADELEALQTEISRL
jgi:hypothetical protein